MQTTKPGVPLECTQDLVSPAQQQTELGGGHGYRQRCDLPRADLGVDAQTDRRRRAGAPGAELRDHLELLEVVHVEMETLVERIPDLRRRLDRRVVNDLLAAEANALGVHNLADAGALGAETELPGALQQGDQAVRLHGARVEEARPKCSLASAKVSLPSVQVVEDAHRLPQQVRLPSAGVVGLGRSIQRGDSDIGEGALCGGVRQHDWDPRRDLRQPDLALGSGRWAPAVRARRPRARRPRSPAPG
mmetsp:Transcript_21365/g.61566  ORF Transcript_21365/g.61566 Transcript_21365/m.61566 type:complete len:247 (+) Transcript_21365:225-965(+)